MRRFGLVFGFVFAISCAFAQTLFTVGGAPVSAEEFKAVYLKNRDIGKDIDPKTPEEYLELYVNFKLKVREAMELGMDTMPAFVREFGRYKQQLAQPYLEDRAVDSLLLAEAFSRMQTEVHAAHIMLDLPPDAMPEDTLAVYKQMQNIRAQAEKGATFESLARKFSTDKGSAINGGDLGYFTVFNMVYPFENAAYNTPVGEVSMPIRSQYGYHLVKVLDKRKSRGTVQVKHIFLISNEKTESAKAEAAAARIKEIYERLQAGEDFDQLAKQFSEDKNTADKGGLLQPFGLNAMMLPFEDAAFALQNPGDFSEPFQTQIGWHIVQLVEKKGTPPLQEVKAELEQRISRDQRAAKSKQMFLANLKKDYNLTENNRSLEAIYKVVDESILSGSWDASKASKLNKTLFSIDGKAFSQADFVAFLSTEQKRGARSKSAKQEVYRLYQSFVDKTIMEYEKSQLPKKYPMYKMLVQEYHDGILLFDLTQEKVWNKASQDSAGLYNYYQKNLSAYMWPMRAKATFYSCNDEKIAKKVAKMIDKGATVQAIEEKFNAESQLNVITETGIYKKGDEPAVDQANWKQNTVTTVALNGRYVVVLIEEILEPTPKALDEARGLIISDYQKQLEVDWLAELRRKYPVTINQDVMRSIEAELK